MKFSGLFYYLTRRGFRVGYRLRVGGLGFRGGPRGLTPYVGLSSLFKGGRRRR